MRKKDKSFKDLIIVAWETGARPKRAPDDRRPPCSGVQDYISAKRGKRKEEGSRHLPDRCCPGDLCCSGKEVSCGSDLQKPKREALDAICHQLPIRASQRKAGAEVRVGRFSAHVLWPGRITEPSARALRELWNKTNRRRASHGGANS